MQVRRYEDRADARAIARVQALSWREAYAELLPDEVLDAMDPDPPDEQVEQYHADCSANREGVFLAEADDERVGFADVRWGEDTKQFVDEDEAGLKAIYVVPERWGEGVGSALLERGIESLPGWVETLKLEMLDGNEVGARFYEARGFERVGESTYELADEAYPTVIYAREL